MVVFVFFYLLVGVLVFYVIFLVGVFMFLLNPNKVFVMLFGVELMSFSVLLCVSSFFSVLFFILLTLVIMAGVVMTVLVVQLLGGFNNSFTNSFVL